MPELRRNRDTAAPSPILLWYVSPYLRSRGLCLLHTLKRAGDSQSNGAYEYCRYGLRALL